MAQGDSSLDSSVVDFNFHLEPDSPVEIMELTSYLASIARQYQQFAVQHGLGTRTADARLLISNVAPGSIDINLIPDLVTISAPLLLPLIDQGKLLIEFGDKLRKLLDLFKAKGSHAPSVDITVTDCDDAQNIVSPVAKHGGSQTFNIIKNQNIHPILVLPVDEAIEILETAIMTKNRLLSSLSIEEPVEKSNIRQRVPLIWTRLDRDKAKTEGKHSPDKGLIEEIDGKPHPVLFADHVAALKREMIQDEENPYQSVYFIDVEISRISGKIVSYRVVGYHGKERLS